jgi:DnaJ homolog subfamily C member 28
MSFLDDLLKNASADWQNLPGQGKPLNLDENPYTPEQMRMAHKILKDNDLAPAWIMEGKEIDTHREKLIDQLHRSSTMKQSLQDAVTAFNRRVLSYNLKVPQGIPHKRMIDVERELGRR